MIHIELSVEPHYKNCRWDPNNPLTRTPDSPPPHVIWAKAFDSWDEAQTWHRNTGLQTDSDSIGRVLDNPDNEYVGVELEVLDITSTAYTVACLSIEGNET